MLSFAAWGDAPLKSTDWAKKQHFLYRQSNWIFGRMQKGAKTDSARFFKSFNFPNPVSTKKVSLLKIVKVGFFFSNWSKLVQLRNFLPIEFPGKGLGIEKVWEREIANLI